MDLGLFNFKMSSILCISLTLYQQSFVEADLIHLNSPSIPMNPVSLNMYKDGLPGSLEHQIQALVSLLAPIHDPYD
jgi:hypothetical protein